MPSPLNAFKSTSGDSPSAVQQKEEKKKKKKKRYNPVAMPTKEQMQQIDGATALFNLARLAELKHAQERKVEAANALIQLSQGQSRGNNNDGQSNGNSNGNRNGNNSGQNNNNYDISQNTNPGHRR